MDDLEGSKPVRIDNELFQTLFCEMCKVSWETFSDDLEKHINKNIRKLEGRYYNFDEAGLFLSAEAIKMEINSPLLLRSVYCWKSKPFLVAEVYSDYYYIKEIKQ